MKSYRRLRHHLVAILLCLAAPLGLAQEYGSEPEHRNIAALVIGITHEGRRNNDPSLGLEYERRVGLRVGFGALVEHTFGDDDFTVFAQPIAFHVDRWKLFAAPGIEDSDRGSETLLRIGFEYAFERGRYEISPQHDIDFVDGEQVVVLGVAFGLPF